MIGHVLYILAAAVLALALPVHSLLGHMGLALTIGVIGGWRYGWAAVNFLRAQFFVHVAHPVRRRKAEIAYRDLGFPAHAFFLVTTYKISPDITSRVYRSVLAAAIASPGGATVVASVVDAADERLIQKVFDLSHSVARPDGAGQVRLIIDRIAGTGKRDALATSLRTIARCCPSKRDVVVFVDGDSCPPEDIIERSAPFFTDPKVGALTTDELCEISSGGLFRDWFNLRFTQRQMMMSSMGLSRRILTLTGRMSVFRATLACNGDFIRSIESDYLNHWRLGRVQFLTGDDKSSWFWLLRNGYLMLYLPDVSSVSMETQPLDGFFSSATTLMTRWFGNMLRTNGRAIALGPTKIGAFTWWSLVDQRVSMWTTLLGPATILVSGILIDPAILLAYLAWVMTTRYIYCWILFSFRRSFPITYPFLLYFSQVFGAFVKTYVLFRLDRQKWTRQTVSRQRVAQKIGIGRQLKSLGSAYFHILSMGWLLLTAVTLS